jgi:GcrA cell cycle regulator
VACTRETGRRPVALIERDAATSWTEERLAELRRLWVEETLSSSEIAQRMGISRGTVMGKINRLGLLRHRSASSLPLPPEPAPPLTASSGADMHTTEDLASQHVSHHPTIFELRVRHCRFPLGGFREPAVFFCGKPAELPMPYCRECCRRAYVSGQPRK